MSRLCKSFDQRVAALRGRRPMAAAPTSGLRPAVQGCATKPAASFPRASQQQSRRSRRKCTRRVCQRASRMASWLGWTRLALPPGEAHGRILAAARFVFALAAAAHARARAAANRAARTSRLLGLSTLREPRLASLVP